MDDAFGVLATTSIGLIVFFGIIAIAFYVVYVIALAKLFKKAGEDGWKAIIPFYNVFVLIQIAGLNWWYFLIAISGTICTIAKIDGLNYICNLAGMAVNFFAFYNIAKKMKQQPVGYGVAGALVAPIITMILGFSDKYTFDPSVQVSPNGPIGDTKESTSNEPEKYCLGCGCKLKAGTKFCEKCGKEVQ